MSIFVRSFLLLSLTAYVVGSVGFSLLYYCLHYRAFGEWYRMPLYQYEHPFQYISVVAVPYGFLGALWVVFMGRAVGIYRWLGLAGVILGSVIISSMLGGLLWEFHDMQAGYFPPRDRMIAAFEDGAQIALLWGPILISLSFPLNLISLAIGLWMPIRLSQWLHKRGKNL